jgi:hypothetical protein
MIDPSTNSVSHPRRDRRGLAARSAAQVPAGDDPHHGGVVAGALPRIDIGKMDPELAASLRRKYQQDYSKKPGHPPQEEDYVRFSGGHITRQWQSVREKGEFQLHPALGRTRRDRRDRADLDRAEVSGNVIRRSDPIASSTLLGRPYNEMERWIRTIDPQALLNDAGLKLKNSFRLVCTLRQTSAALATANM